jgi:Dehydrogenases with different specificities (related to short-chain alcohol dehydrogenases)
VSWTPDEIDDLSGQRCVVTGANSGIGFHAAKVMAEQGADVVLACRSVEKGEDAASDMDGDTEVVELDLASKESIQGFSSELSGGFDVIVNNAGVMNIPWKTTDFGFEYQFGVNFLGHFYLNSLVLDRLRTGGRVVTVTSLAMRGGELDFDSLNRKETYEPWQAYGDSKLADMVYALELQRRLDENDVDASSHAAHPGMASTDLFRRGPEMRGNRLKLAAMKIFIRLFAQSAEKGSWATVHAATADLNGGSLSGPSGLFKSRGAPEIQSPVEDAEDTELGRKLWDFAEQEMECEFRLGDL